MERSAIRGMPAQQRRAPRRGAVNTRWNGWAISEHQEWMEDHEPLRTHRRRVAQVPISQ